MNAPARTVELVFFDGCPNAEHARDHLRSALRDAGVALDWTEWDLESDRLPDRLRGYGSPTVLVDGRDVTGGENAGASDRGDGIACRADGAPTTEQIQAALRRA